jgi:hypothetical protein
VAQTGSDDYGAANRPMQGKIGDIGLDPADRSPLSANLSRHFTEIRLREFDGSR